MNGQLFFLITILLLNVNLITVSHQAGSCPDPDVNDGPYIFNQDGKIRIWWIKSNMLREDFVTQKNFKEIKNRFNFLFDYRDLTDSSLLIPTPRQIYRKVDSIAVLSDIHGEYYTYVNLLKANDIVDENLNWNFGKGHLVVLGDVFDRGEMVTEVLWHLFGLGKKASRAGGMVHLLFGNHEFMVLNQNLSYTNDKYRKVEEISGARYFDFYSKNSVLGKWLRSRPLVITINDIIFVHGGISIEMVHREIGLSRTNQSFSKMIAGKEIRSIQEFEQLSFLIKNNGPLWYRGYFTDGYFTESRLDSILGFYGKNHIVVGHTPDSTIKSRFYNKILGVDSGIGNGNSGEMLIIKDGIFYKGSFTGRRTELSAVY